MLRMPWRLLVIDATGRTITVAYVKGDRYCVHALGFEVRETSASVELTALSEQRPGQATCPADLRIGSGTIELKQPLGERPLLHSEVSKNWVATGCNLTD